MGAYWRGVFTTVVSLIAMHAATGFAQKKTDVDLVAPDGIKLKGSYFAAARPGPGILLLHMCGGATRTSWDRLAATLSAKGFHVVTVDYRGFGESGDARFDGLDVDARRAQQAKWAADFDTAFDYLVAQPGVDRERIGAGGASCGVNNSIQLALRHPQVKSLVLLSGGASRSGVDYIRRSPWLAVLLAASEDDSGFVPYMRWLFPFSPNPQNRLLEYKRAGHGTDMFAAEKDLEPSIVEFFSTTLTAPAASRATALPDSQPHQQVQFWSLLNGPDGVTKARQALRDAKVRDTKVVLMPELEFVLLGYDHLREGNPKEAVAVMQLGLEENPDSLDLHYTVATAYAEAGDPAMAIEHTQKALDLLQKDTTMTAEEKAGVRERLQSRLEQFKVKR